MTLSDAARDATLAALTTSSAADPLFAAVDPTLEKLLGRPPATFGDVLAATLP